MDEDDIWLGDRLPTIYDVAQTIFHYSKTLNSNKRKEVVHRYAVALRNIWIKGFTEKHVLLLTSVKNRIEKIMKDYENFVRIVNSSNKKDPTSLRARNKPWMSMDVPKPKNENGDFKNCKNSSLFDFSRNMETTKDKGGIVVEGLTGNEKLFYEDQRVWSRTIENTTGRSRIRNFVPWGIELYQWRTWGDAFFFRTRISQRRSSIQRW